MKVYIDVLVMENIVMNYLILLLTAKFMRHKPSHLRLFLGALAGAAYVVVLLLMPNLKVYCTTLAKFALSLLIVAIAFSPAKPALFIKTLAVFYVSTFIFAGAAFAFLYLNQTGGFVRNGIVYIWNSKGTTLFLLWQPSA